MHRLARALLALSLLLAGPAQAQKAPAPAPAYPAPATVKRTATQRVAEPDEASLQTHEHYRNKAGQQVHAPAKSVDNNIPAGASAKCRDGSYSFSKSRRGTCSHHGGVAAWL